MLVSWEDVGALVALISAIVLVNLWATRSIVRQAIAELMRDLHRTDTGFVPRETCGLLHRQANQGLAALSTYAHDSGHQLRDDLAGLTMLVRAIDKQVKGE